MPPLPIIFGIWTPREDVINGAITESDFAADLAQILRCSFGGLADSVKFFGKTHPAN